MSWCDFVAGWVGGTIGLVIGHPFETVKVNQQAHDLGIIRSTKRIYKYGWYKGFFRGLGFPLLANGSVNSLFFGSYAVTLNWLVNGRKPERPTDPNAVLEYDIKRLMYIVPSEESIKKLQSDDSKFDGPKATNLQCFLAGSAAGLIELCIACPVELIKIKLQSTASTSAKTFGPFDLVRKNFVKHGIKGLYQGLTVMAIRDIPARGIYMLSYHVCSKDMKHKAGNNNMASVLGLFVAGGIAGTVSWCSIIPIDVIKSRIQSEDLCSSRYKGIWDCSRQIYNENGVRGFVRGGLPLALRAFPVNGAAFLTIEWLTFLCRYRY